jgi:hypothetical protein
MFICLNLHELSGESQAGSLLLVVPSCPSFVRDFDGLSRVIVIFDLICLLLGIGICFDCYLCFDSLTCRDSHACFGVCLGVILIFLFMVILASNLILFSLIVCP